MAKLIYNVVSHGVSGKIGDLVVFTQRHGKTFIGKVPRRKDKRSQSQLAVREKFVRAVVYAKASMKDPSVKALYEPRAKDGVIPFNLAIADFFTAPVIEDIITSGYTG